MSTGFNPDWYDPKEVEQYKNAIKTLRLMWSRVPTPSGKPSRGPQFFAVTMCDECRGIGMTSTKHPIKKRWVCKTCGGCALPIWTDGPLPTEDEIWEQWAKGKK